MTDVIWTTARWHACPGGDRDPKSGSLVRTVVPDGSDLKPRCTACHEPMAPEGDTLTGTWRLDECCVPSDPSGRWYGPPRDPAVCARCYGTQLAPICTRCLLPGCPGIHAGCAECDGEGTVPCPACDGDGHLYDQTGADKSLCPNPDCVAGAVACPACGGAGSLRRGRR